MNDFQEVNESTKATLRELAEQTIEFVANGVSHFGKLEFYKGNVQVIDDTVQESLGYLFFFDRESAEGWQTFMVETTQTGQTYENTPLQLVTHWRLVPSTRPTEALQSPKRADPIIDTLPTHLEWHDVYPDMPKKSNKRDWLGKEFLVYSENGGYEIFYGIIFEGEVVFQPDDNRPVYNAEAFYKEYLVWARL